MSGRKREADPEKGEGNTKKKKELGPNALRKMRNKMIESHFGYSNEFNPFNDANLSEPFVWNKKVQYLKAAGQYRKATTKQTLEQATTSITEIEAVKKRREERELETQELEEQKAILAREKEQENYDEWAAKEEDFHLEQAKLRSEIRIQQGREDSIDLLSKGLRILDGSLFDELTLFPGAPHEIFDELSSSDIANNLAELKTHLASDRKYATFWKSLIIVGEDCLEKAKRFEESQDGNATSAPKRDARTGISMTVLEDIQNLLARKTYEELKDLEEKVAKKLRKGGEDVDFTYWEAIQSSFPLYKARVYCADLYEKARALATEAETARKRKDLREAMRAEAPPKVQPEVTNDDDDGDSVDLNDGRYSPVLEPYDEPESPDSPLMYPVDESKCHSPILDPIDDLRTRRQQRKLALEGFSLSRAKMMAESKQSDGPGDPARRAAQNNFFDEFIQKERKTLAANEEVMIGEYQLKQKHFDWEDKYRPRKPRFFNRVKTGFEWNKYNQTHYDRETPPPRVVQGYKFNIFYPDLIDPTQTPTYHLEPSDTTETIVIRFHAGPPYEDVAFKILNREWSFAQHHGFRNVFDRGILQVYFGFMRYRYRR